MGGKGRGGRSRTQRKHFRDNRENVWKRPKPDPNSANDNKDGNGNGNSNHWEPFESQSSAFNEYYKVCVYSLFGVTVFREFDA